MIEKPIETSEMHSLDLICIINYIIEILKEREIDYEEYSSLTIKEMKDKYDKYENTIIEKDALES